MLSQGDAEYNRATTRTNILVSTGAITKLQALQREADANKNKLIDLKEKQVALMLGRRI